MKKIVIVGGGILGLSAAYYLQISGLAQVTVLEAGSFAAATTSQAAALLTRARTELTDGLMVDETHRVIKQFEQEFQQPFMQRHGCIHMASHGESFQAELFSLQAHHQQGKERSANSEWLSAEQIRKQLPWLTVNNESRGLFYPDDGHADPYLLASFYLQAAKKAGAYLHQGVRIKQLLESNGKIMGVRSENNENWIADAVLIAAGPWSSVLVAQHNVKLGMAPVRSHYWITDNQALVKPSQAMAIVPSSKVYFRAENKGLLFGVRDSQICIADPRDLPESQQGIHSHRFENDENGWLALEENWQGLIETCPLLETAQLNHYISGISSYTPDSLPLLGPSEEWKNLFVATGCSGAGIAWSGGIGRLLSEQILQQETFVDCGRYGLNRFDNQIENIDPMDATFRQICAQARTNKKTG
ncbi:MAG: FAD-binding oxidoreductase [Oleispira sp.]|nr:FAD-binding oxidoreductase [Oleispira sp.]